ncbi:MAG: ABC transporter substrate-binding protein [Candidatus Velthaea sp.]
MSPILRVVTASIAALLLVPAAGAPSRAADTVKVGVVLPLTGNLAAFGKTSEQGLELAAKDINEHGGVKSLGGAHIDLVIRDSTSEPSGAAEATTRLIDDVHPIALIGAYASALSLTASTVAERRNVPFLTMSFTDDLTSRNYKYTFQVVPKASEIGAKQLAYAAEIASESHDTLKTIAIVYEDTAYGTSQANGLKALAEKTGIKVALFEAYPHGLSDALPLVQKIDGAKAQVLFPVSYFTDAVLIVRALKQTGSKTQIVGGAAGFVIPEFAKSLGGLTEHIMSIDTSAYDHYGPFETQFRKAYGTFAPHEAYENAISLYAVRDALDKSKATTPEALRNALSQLDVSGGPYAGIPGAGVKFDANGLNSKARPVMVQWRKGELVSIWPQARNQPKPIWTAK